MDATGILKKEVSEPVATLLVPGAFALAPYICVIGYYFPGFWPLWANYSLTFGFASLLSALSVGLLLEDIGTFLEARVWDAILQCKNPDHLSEWESYLKLTVPDGLIAQHYLRTLRVGMKFEIGVGIAAIASWFGLLWFQLLTNTWSPWPFLIITFCFLILVLYLLRESYQTAKLLGRSRRLILEATGGKEKD